MLQFLTKSTKVSTRRTKLLLESNKLNPKPRVQNAVQENSLFRLPVLWALQQTGCLEVVGTNSNGSGIWLSTEGTEAVGEQDEQEEEGGAGGSRSRK